MTLTLSKLLNLKKVLQTSRDLKLPSDLFWKEFAGKPEFLAMSQPGADDRLVEIIERGACRVLGGAPRVANLTLARIPGYRFWHGTCELSGKLAQVIYFDDIDCGLLTILKNAVTGEILYVRFSVLEIDGPGNAIPINPRETPRA